MSNVMVLVTEGKYDSADYAQVVTFDNSTDALLFCKEKNTGRTKYWTKAEIVKDSEQVELCCPDEEG